MYKFNLMMAGSSDWLSLEEAAEYLGKSAHWLYQNRVRLGIPHTRVGGTYRFQKAQLQEWVEQRSIAVPSSHLAKKTLRKITL